MKYLKEILFIFLIVFLLASIANGQEVISEFSNETLPVLNDELNKMTKSVSSVSADVDTLSTTVTGKFNTTTGHDHDGTDSKKVLATDLDTTGLSAGTGYYVYNNSGALATAATSITSGLSNVIFQWTGIDSQVDDTSGLYAGTGVAASAANHDFNLYFGVAGTTYKTILVGKFIKISGISTITINARLWSDNNASDREAILSVDVGGQANTVKSVTTATPAWVIAQTIDVSSLTNGTTYDITIQLKNENTNSAYCSAVVLTAS